MLLCPQKWDMVSMVSQCKSLDTGWFRNGLDQYIYMYIYIYVYIYVYIFIEVRPR